MRTRQALVNGIRNRWLEAGAGTPVVFVHGIPTSPELWRHVIPLVENGRCLAWEMIGYGDSMPEGDGLPIGLSRQAGYLVAWLREVVQGPAALVGHDLGGGVVQIAATRDPGVCAGLVLVDSVAHGSWPIATVKAVRRVGGLVERLPDVAFGPMLRGLVSRGHDDRVRARESAALHWGHYRIHGGARRFVRQARSLDGRDTTGVGERLGSLGVPARVLWGTRDPFQGVEHGERLARALGTTLLRMEGARHFTPEDHPEPIARAVEDLLREVRRAGQDEPEDPPRPAPAARPPPAPPPARRTAPAARDR